VKAAVLAVLALSGCAGMETQQRPPEVRTITNTVSVPVPVPCFTEAERPILPPLTPIDIDRATVDQMAAALAADEINEALYRSAVDALFLKCMKGPAK